MEQELQRGIVQLADHDPEWGKAAAEKIEQLWKVLGSLAVDIQHIGSTAISGIKAKLFIDIAICVESFAVLTDKLFLQLDEIDVYKSPEQPLAGILLGGVRKNTHLPMNLHFVEAGSEQWQNHIDFRDYMNAFPEKARAYEGLKIEMAAKHPNDRDAYTKGKAPFIQEILREAGQWACLRDIPGYERFVKIEPIHKGLSSDRKYYIETVDGQKLLLRVNDVENYDTRKLHFDMMVRAATLDIVMSRPVAFGTCNDGKNVFSLLTWCEGTDAEELLPLLPDAQQYVLGIKAAELLKKLHSLPAPEDAEPWNVWFWRKVQGRIDFYNTHPIKSVSGDKIIRHLQEERDVLIDRPQTFRHGDFNVSNIIVSPDEDVGVIDFNAYNLDHSDPWWEFCAFIWGADPSAHFYTGLFKGYFGGEPPREFFEVFSYYLAYDALAALCDTSEYNQGPPEDGRRHMDNVLRWFDDMQNPVPTWYLKDFYVQRTDGVPYKLKAPFDFSFLSKYGKVFKVFDDQDSGNICFGVSDGEKRYFVKFAGASTDRACVSTEEAIANLKRTVPVYQDLAHPNLIKLVAAEEIGGAGRSCAGFAEVFEWVDAECMGRQYPLSREKFLHIPLETRLQVFADILAFHAHTAKQGYVAIDFYDGSIMYDFNNRKTVICDIDFYTKAPYVNNMGRLWGSSRFMSPEEFQMGAAIDVVTNVYTMGATAFALFGDERDRSIEKWRAGQKLYDVAKRAVSEERCNRQQSIAQLIAQWEAAKCESPTE